MKKTRIFAQDALDRLYTARTHHVRQLDLEPFKAHERVVLRSTCPCGAKGRIAVLAHFYYATGFVKPPFTCDNCKARK